MNNPPPPPPYQPEQPYVAPDGNFDDGPKKKGWSGILVGCLVAFGISVVLCAGVGFYAYSQASTWIIAGVRTTAEAVLKDSGLPAEEQNAILEQLDRVTTAYENGEITMEELGVMMQDLAESPMIGIVMLQAIEVKYLNSSGLSEEEQEAGKRVIMRVVRAAQEKKLEKDEIDNLSRHILTEADASKPQGQQQQLRPSLTDDELRAFFAEAKELVDEKEIPDEDYEFQISDIIKQEVDEALAK